MTEILKVTVPLSELKDSLRSLKGFIEKFDEGWEKVQRRSLRDLRARTPRSRKMSQGVHLASCWGAERSKRGSQFGLRFFNTAPHADVLKYLEGGTVAHRIVGNPFLAFKVGRKLIIVRSVQHPGTKALKIVSTAIDNTKENIERMFLEVMSETEREFFK